MGLYVSLAALSTTAGANAADGAVDAPSTIDNNMNLLASFTAQLRDRYAAFPSGSPTSIAVITTLTAAQKGGVFFFNANVQATLPAVAGVSSGDTFTFIGGGLGGTIKGSGAELVITPLGISANTYTVGRGETLQLVSNGISWYIDLAGFSGASFADSLGGTGYKKWPASNSGAAPLIEQWGTTTLTLNGSSAGAITYPIAFPTAPFSCVACLADNNILGGVALINSQFTASAFGFQVSGAPGAVSARIAWFARGN